MTQGLVQVDAFADRAFAGNPAGVCVMDSPGDQAWMQNVAMEMNLAETAFLYPRGDAFHLRWFTPTVEVDLCGHATLAAAHVLWENKILANDAIARFETRSGLLTARRDGSWIELDFPSTPPAASPQADALYPQLMPALGGVTGKLLLARFDYFVEVESESIVRNLNPDMQLLKQIPSRGVIVTARSDDPQFDFVSRFFAPQSGVDEDPVTGSAHCALAPYWRDRLGRNPLVGFQASRRGGIVRVNVQGDRVLLGGQAITTLRGMLVC
jgi:PhzF family phenazine biosynthesis protein